MALRLTRAAFIATPFPLPSTLGNRLSCRPATACRPARLSRRTMRMTAWEGDDFPDSTHSPWASHLESPQSTLIAASAPKLEGAAPPPSVPAGGDFGGGGGDGDSSDDLLHQFGRSGEKLAPEIRSLPHDQLAHYLTATQSAIARWLAAIWPGWRRRCAADPEFPFKVLMELTVGVGLSGSGMIAARGKNILKELDFALCDLAVGAAVNFILVYLLTPTVGMGAGGLMGVMNRMPANMFAEGAFGLGSRVGSLVFKGGLFAVAGFMASVIGTVSSRGLVLFRRKMFNDESDKPFPSILATSLAWGGFMFVSSNPRYQIVAGLERGLFTFAPDAVAKTGSALLRTGNNIIGGSTWVWWARYIGLQKKAEEVQVAEEKEALKAQEEG